MSSNIHLVQDTSDGGFLSGFVEASVELPRDGRNGKCIVHYEGCHQKYELIVKLVDGMREGKALLVNDGVPYLNLEFTKGSMTGKVKRQNQYGMVDLKGHIVNGIEDGLFEEYNNCKIVVWRGYYRNGRRYSRITESKRLKGYYDETSVSSGSLLSVAQYDRSLHDKNGHCLLYENGDWVGEWIYEKGVRILPIREYRNGVLTLYDPNGNKTCEGSYSKEDIMNGLYVRDPMEGMNGYYKEVDSHGRIVTIAEYDPCRVKKNGCCFQLEYGKLKRVYLYQSGKMVRELMRFHGSTMIEYAENGRVIYEGEFKGSMKTGFVRAGSGKEYTMSTPNGLSTDRHDSMILIGKWSNGKKNGVFYEVTSSAIVRRKYLYRNDRIVRLMLEFDGLTMTEYDKRGNRRYVGNYQGDMKRGFWREGNGSEYGRDGKIAVYTGQWKNGWRDGKGTAYWNGWSVYSGKWKYGICTWLVHLLLVVIILVGVVAIIWTCVLGMNEYYNIRIEDCSQLNRISPYRSNQARSLSFTKECSCKEVRIGDKYFKRIRQIDLNGLSGLERIEIGKQSFSSQPTEPWYSERTNGSCRIVNCSRLKSIRIQDYAFSDYHSFELRNLPSLESIQMGKGCFYRASRFSLTGRTESVYES